MNYIYYSLIHKENQDVELKCCIDLDTIDDDQPEVEYEWNDGTWATAHPDYWNDNGYDCYFLLQELCEIEVQEWSWISQALIDCEDSFEEVFVREFDKANLYISYDRDFSSENAKNLPTGILIDNDYPHKE